MYLFLLCTLQNHKLWPIKHTNFHINRVDIEFSFNEAWCNKHSTSMKQHKAAGTSCFPCSFYCSEILLESNKADTYLKVLMNFASLQIVSLILHFISAKKRKSSFSLETHYLLFEVLPKIRLSVNRQRWCCIGLIWF